MSGGCRQFGAGRDGTRGGRWLPQGAALLLALGCADGSTPPDLPESDLPASLAALVSDPSPSPASGTPVAWVSILPGTVPHGARVEVRNQTARTGASSSMVGGGLDPFDIPARPGDTLTISASDSAGGRHDAMIEIRARVAPRVVRVSPGPRTTDVPLNTRIEVVFSEPITLQSAREGLELRGPAGPVAGSMASSTSGHIVVLLPSAPLQPRAQYSVTIDERVADLDGDHLVSGLTTEFTTGAAMAPAAPMVLALSNGALSLLDISTGWTLQLTRPASEYYDARPTWSPDGQLLAFVRSSRRAGTADQESAIYVINADGTGLRRLSAPESRDFAPSWSGDGRRIAFQSSRDWEGYGGTSPNYTSSIYIMERAGNDPGRVTDLTRYAYSPSWSPDGSLIAFATAGSDGGTRIHVMAPDGSGVRAVSAGPADDAPSWAPDGTIVFHRWGTGGDGTRDGLFSVRPDGTGEVRLPVGTAGDQWPVWSATGAELAFTRPLACDWYEQPSCVDDAYGTYVWDQVRRRTWHIASAAGGAAWKP